MAREYYHSNHLPIGTKHSGWATMRRIRTQVVKSDVINWPRVANPVREGLPIYYLGTAYSYPIYCIVAPLIDTYGGYLTGSLAGDAWVIYLDTEQEFLCSLPHELIHIVLNLAPARLSSDGLSEEEIVVRLTTLNLTAVQNWIDACVCHFKNLYEVRHDANKFVVLNGTDLILE